MRTALILLGGFVLWGLCLAAAKFLGGGTKSATTAATIGFVVAWFVAAAVNLWIGVTRAGYSFREELPIFLVIFLVPAAVALVVRSRLS
jgi:hypothetical protein